MKKKRRLLWQLYPSYLIIIVIALVSITLYGTRSQRAFYIQQAVADLEARARILDQQVSPYLAAGDYAAVDRLCKAAGKPSATRITVVLPSGLVIGDSEENPAKMDNHARRPEIKSAFKGHTDSAVRFSNTLGQTMLYVAVPMLDYPEQGAVIRTSISLAAIESEIKSIQVKMLSSGLVIALLAAAISLWVARRISRPIEALRHGAEQFADGHLTHRLPVPNSLEVGGLAEEMNRMASQLNERIGTIIEQRNELEAVLSSMIEGVMAVDREEYLISINQAAAKMFGSNSTEMLGRSIQEVIRNSDLQRFISDALASGKPSEGDIILYGKQERILYVHSNPLKDVNDERVGTLIVINDVTKLRHLENVRKDFAANVSHELKTPLTAIKGFVETLQHGKVEDTEQIEHFLSIVAKHVNRLAAIIDDLMQLSKVEQEAERDQVAMRPGRLAQTILDAMAVCAPQAEKKQVQVQLQPGPDITVLMDATLLEQAFVNLIDNAIKFSPAGETVHIATEQTQAEIIVRFKDHGVGIAKSHLPRLFERFYRVDKARSRKLGGTGLGLAIVKHIVQAHQGRIEVDSTPGQGTIFTIHLPRK